MSNFAYVTLVAFGGVPVRLADSTGSPYPTTGQGALVFANGPVLTNAVLNGFVMHAPIGADSNGTQASPAFYILTTDKGLYSTGNGNVSIAAADFTLASFTTGGGGTFIDFFGANGTRVDLTSDTANEMILGAFPNPTTKLTINKYGGDVQIGSASIGLGSNLGNLKVHGSADVTNDATLTIGGDAFSAVYFANRAISVRAGSGDPTISGTYGSLYLENKNSGLTLPWVNTDNGTTWDRLVSENATQTISNKAFINSTFSGPFIATSLQVIEGTITSNTPVLITQTWNNAGVTFEGLKMNITHGAQSNPSYLMRLQTDAADMFLVRDNGAVTMAQALTVQAGGAAITGNSSVTGTLDVTAGLTVDSGGVIVTAGGLTITAGGETITAGDLTLNGGNVLASGHVTAEKGLAIPAGGTQDAGFLFSSTAHFGIIFGSGAAAASMAQGSLYLRSDGVPAFNTNGTTGWMDLVGLTNTQTLQGKTISTANNTITGTGASASNFLRGDNSFASPLGVSTQVFTASGTYTPHAKLLYAIIECVGGGGGGGGVANSAANTGGSAGAGGAGSYARSTVSAATIGANQTVTIGAAGTGATAGNNAGGAGGDTSVGALVIGKGGSPGSGTTGAAGGAGGVAGTGDFTVVGGAGGGGFILNVTGSLVTAAPAGQAYFGGGVPSVSASTLRNGTAASGYGNGGGAGQTYNGAGAAAGGAGAAGVVVITEFWVP